jgi:hypothetical protein
MSFSQGSRFSRLNALSPLPSPSPRSGQYRSNKYKINYRNYLAAISIPTRSPAEIRAATTSSSRFSQWWTDYLAENDLDLDFLRTLEDRDDLK